MHQQSLNSTDLALSAAGPVLIGAILGLGGVHGVAHIGAVDVLHTSMTLPVILFGVTAAMIPALYIATSLSGAAPPAREVALAVLRGFRSCGIAMLGLAAPVAFLLCTSDGSRSAVFVGMVVTSVGVFAGLRVLFADLFERAADSVTVPFTARLVFGAWSLVSLAIGARMYEQFLAG